MSFPPGTLLDRVRSVSAEALADGALHPISTSIEQVMDQGVRFIVHVVDNLQRKASVRRPPGHDPFLPYDSKLYVADVSPDHVCLLNKFNVMADHLLVVTRHFEEQQSLLNERDFAALLTCMAELPSLGFYNSGPAAGASQTHKHLQLVPLPLTESSGNEDVSISFPMESIWRAAQLSTGSEGVAALPFRHSVIRLEHMDQRSPQAHRYIADWYQQMLRSMELVDGNGRVLGAYNLLITSDWMFLVPRSQECCQGISLNALAFAGALLVRDANQLVVVRQLGPMSMLREVSFPDCL